MSEMDSQNPGWWDADEPLPMEVLDAIRIADREDGTAEQVARLEARLAPLLQAPQGVAPPSRGTGATGGSLGTLKLVAAGVALLGAATLLWRQPSVSHGPSTLIDKSAQPSSPSGSLSQAPGLEEPRSPSVQALGAQTTPELEEPAAALSVPDHFEVEAGGSAREQNKAHARPARAVARESSQPNSLALEARLLSRARRHLETAPEQALALSDLHQRRFPQGVLSEEREVIAIQALRRNGRESAAAQRQSRFLAKYPQSPHALSLTHGARP